MDIFSSMRHPSWPPVAPSASPPGQVYFDVPLRADVFAVAGEHVVYKEIVVPGSRRIHQGANVATSIRQGVHDHPHIIHISTIDYPYIIHISSIYSMQGRILTRTSEYMSLNLVWVRTPPLAWYIPWIIPKVPSPNSPGRIHPMKLRL